MCRASEDCRVALEAMIDQVCCDLPEVIIPASVAPRTKLESPIVVPKASRTEIHTFWAEFEQQIIELQMQLQPETPSEV